MTVDRLLALVVILMAAPSVFAHNRPFVSAVAILAGGAACYWLYRSFA